MLVIPLGGLDARPAAKCRIVNKPEARAREFGLSSLARASGFLKTSASEDKESSHVSVLAGFVERFAGTGGRLRLRLAGLAAPDAAAAQRLLKLEEISSRSRLWLC